jgi:hypothetical protein
MHLATPGRIARAIVAATVLGAALTGCTVAIDGTPQPDPHPVARSTPQPSRPATPAPRSDEYRTPRSIVGTPPLPLNSGEPLAPHAAVLSRWVVDGWTPLPLLRQTDRATGTSAAMFGPAKTTTTSDGVPYFSANGAPAGILSTFGSVPSPAGRRTDAEEAARRTAAKFGGRLISHERLVVDGRPVHDSVMDVPSPTTGTEMRQLIRRIDLPEHFVLIQTLGPRSEERTMAEVHDIVTGTFSAP